MDLSRLVHPVMEIMEVDPSKEEPLDPHAMIQKLVERRPLLLERVGRALFCDEQQAKLALEEVAKFLILASRHGDGPLTPSPRLDLAWHEWILFTKEYLDFCQEHFGKMIHHEPGGEPRNNQRQFQATLRLYRESFGAPPPSIWDSGQATASCGNCENQ